MGQLDSQCLGPKWVVLDCATSVAKQLGRQFCRPAVPVWYGAETTLDTFAIWHSCEAGCVQGKSPLSSSTERSLPGAQLSS